MFAVIYYTVARGETNEYCGYLTLWAGGCSGLLRGSPFAFGAQCIGVIIHLLISRVNAS